MEGVLDKEIVKSFVLEVLNLTKLRVLHLEMLCKSELIVEEIARQDWEWALEEIIIKVGLRTGYIWSDEDLQSIDCQVLTHIIYNYLFLEFVTQAEGLLHWILSQKLSSSLFC